jgi:hypothetical protein
MGTSYMENVTFFARKSKLVAATYDQQFDLSCRVW